MLVIPTPVSPGEIQNPPLVVIVKFTFYHKKFLPPGEIQNPPLVVIVKFTFYHKKFLPFISLQLSIPCVLEPHAHV